MIFDKLENANRYSALHPRFEKAFSFLQDTNLGELSNGRHEISGDEIYASVQEYMTKAPNDADFEAHRKYIDVQLVIKGEERLGVAEIAGFKPNTFYDAGKDIVFGTVPAENESYFVLSENEFVIFYPEDAHKPSLSPNGESLSVKKIVVKILC